MTSVNPEEIKQDIEKLEDIIKKSTAQLTELKNSHWAFGEDSRELESVVISCNYDSWVSAKENNVTYPFYIEDDKCGEAIDLSLNDAKEIIKYLQDKIEYLES